MNSPEPATESAPTPNQKRRRGLLLLAVVVLLAGAAWFAWWYVHARWYVSTEDAYAGATVVQVTSGARNRQICGPSSLKPQITSTCRVPLSETVAIDLAKGAVAGSIGASHGASEGGV